MESIETKVKVFTTVSSVKELSDESDWVHFEGSRESLALPKGYFKPGDKVSITFKKV